jgi:phosphoglucosamine mutase
LERKYFGTDGIRGPAGVGMLAPDRVAALGRAAGAFVADMGGARRVLVGRDTRESGPWIARLLADGFRGAGVAVSDGGILTTPAIQWLAREERFDLAVVVSASHNPAADNGIKFFGGDGRKLPDESELRIEELIDADDGVVVPPRGNLLKDDGAAHRYVDGMRRRLPNLDLTGKTIVLDCAHGAATEIGPELLRRFGAEVVVRHASPDGRNINENAGVFAVKAMAPDVAARKACLGIALDGDADRVLLLDEQGVERDGDAILGVLARDLHARNGLAGARLITTVMSNFGLKHFLRAVGIAVEVTPVGDRYVAQRMATTGTVLGGEQSGHIIFREGDVWSGDGLYAALRVLDVIMRRRLPLSSLLEGFETFPQILENVHAKVRIPTEEIPGLQAAIEKAQALLGDDGRVFIRWSGTEALLRVMVEGRDRPLVERLVADLVAAARAGLA